MKKTTLKLKEEFEGLRITRNDIRVGKITFDANTVKPQHYENYRRFGFDIFEEVIEEIIDVVIDTVIDTVTEKIKRGRRKKL